MLKITDIKKGDTFYECVSGFNDEYVAITNPVSRDGGVAVYGRCVETGARIKFFELDAFSGYLKLYRYPEYV